MYFLYSLLITMFYKIFFPERDALSTGPQIAYRAAMESLKPDKLPD